jgi:hypothetical protein
LFQTLMLLWSLLLLFLSSCSKGFYIFLQVRPPFPDPLSFLLICVDIEFLNALYNIVNFNMYRFILIDLICIIGFFYLYYQLSIYFILIALFSYQSVVCCINFGRWSHWYVNCYICSLFNNKFNCSSESVVGWICWYVNCYICLLYQFVNMLIVIFVHCSMDLNSVQWSIIV